MINIFPQIGEVIFIVADRDGITMADFMNRPLKFLYTYRQDINERDYDIIYVFESLDKFHRQKYMLDLYHYYYLNLSKKPINYIRRA